MPSRISVEISGSNFSSVVNSLAMLFQPVFLFQNGIGCCMKRLHCKSLSNAQEMIYSRDPGKYNSQVQIYQLYLIYTHPFSLKKWIMTHFLLKQTPASFLSAQHWNDSHSVKALGTSLFCWSVWAASHLLFWEGQHSFRNPGGGCWCLLLNED